MTISTTTRIVTHNGNGVTVNFTYPFKIDDAADLLVYLKSGSVFVLKSLGTDYSLTGVRNPGGGTVTFIVAPVSATGNVRFLRRTALNQLVDYITNDDFPAEIHEAALDKLTMAVQDYLGDSLTLDATADYWEAESKVIKNVADPVDPQDAVNKQYIEEHYTATAVTEFVQSGSGAVARTASSKMREILSVADFGASGNGISDATSALSSAVAAALAADAILYWPAGTYLTAANIPNFHVVRHYGPGVVKRGSDLFHVDPGAYDHNTLYVSPSGNNTNDGLSASQPFLTIQAAFDAMVGYGPPLNGSWAVQLAAGTYTTGVYIYGLRSRYPIVLKGPSVGGHPNVPTAIIDGGGLPANSVLVYFQNYMQITAQDVKLINVNASSVALEADYHCILSTNNVHITGGAYTGINVSGHTRLNLSGGIIDGPKYGVNIYGSSQGTVGYGGSAGANRPLIKNCIIAGVWFAGGYGHIDYCDLQNNARNVYLINNSRAHVMGCACSGASIADVVVEGASTWFNDTIVPNTFSSTRAFAHGGCFEQGADSYRFQYDKTTDRFKFGGNSVTTPVAKFEFQCSATTSGSSYNSNTLAVMDFSGTTNWFGLSGPGNSVTGLMWSAPSKPAQGAFYYSFSTDSFEIWGANQGHSWRLDATKFGPSQDNVRSLGDGSLRWSTVYAGTGTINTSDAREKQDIQEVLDAERRVATAIKASFGRYRFKDAVKVKGSKARWHFGVTAQAVRQAFKAEGLDARDYGMFCYDEWPEIAERRDDDGNVIKEYRPAGNRYGLRYDELFAFIIGATV